MRQNLDKFWGRNKLYELAVGLDMTSPIATGLPGGHSEWEPPDPFSNSEVKTLCADASVDFVDVKVGHCQALNLMKTKPSPTQVGEGFFVMRGPRGRHRACCRPDPGNRPHKKLAGLLHRERPAGPRPIRRVAGLSCKAHPHLPAP